MIFLSRILLFSLFLLCAAPQFSAAQETPDPQQVARMQADAARGDVGALIALGILHSTGNGVEKNLDKAVALLTRAAESNSAQAQYLLGLLHGSPIDGRPVDKEKSRYWLKKAAAAGNKKAEAMLPLLDLPEQPVLSNAEILVKAEQGEAGAQYDLYSRYQHGWNGTAKDKILAEKWLRRSADGGYPLAESDYGLMLMNKGRKDEAVIYMTRAAEKGVTHSQYELGMFYLNDEKMRDSKKSFFWLMQAAKNGHEGAKALIETYLRQKAAKTGDPASVPMDKRIAAMPRLPNPGILIDFKKVLAKDNIGEGNLYDLTTAFMQLTIEDVIRDPAAADLMMDAILYRWAGVDKIAPGSRGPNMDARKLAFTEKTVEQRFMQTGAGGLKNPLFWAARGLHQAYAKVFDLYYALIASSSWAQSLFAITVTVKDGKPVINAKLNPTTLGRIAFEISKRPSTAEKLAAWRPFVRILEIPMKHRLPDSDKSLLKAAIATSDKTLTYDKILAANTPFHLRDIPGNDYASRTLGLGAKDGNIADIVRLARKKDQSKQIIFSDIATEIIKKCCRNEQEITDYFKKIGYSVKRRDVKPIENRNLGYTDYTTVLQVGYMSKWDLFKSTIFLPHDQVLIYVYINDKGPDWVFAQLQRW